MHCVVGLGFGIPSARCMATPVPQTTTNNFLPRRRLSLPGDQRVGRLLRLQHLRPERLPGHPPAGPEHVLRHGLQRARPAALARGRARGGGAHPGRQLPDAGPVGDGLPAAHVQGADAGAEHRLVVLE